MEDDTSNIEWKKNGFGEKEILTRKTNEKDAALYKASNKNNIHKNNIVKASDLPKGLKKIRKKIKEVYDEDDEDEYEVNTLNVENNILLNALYEDEKNIFKQQQDTIKITEMQQNAGKMEALMSADKTAKNIGLKGLNKSIINENMQNVLNDGSTFEDALKQKISKEANIKSINISKAETITLLRGIRRIQDMAVLAKESKTKSIEGLRIGDIITAGKKNTDDEQVAKIVLKKTGRKNISSKAKKLSKQSKIKNKNQLRTKAKTR